MVIKNKYKRILFYTFFVSSIIFLLYSIPYHRINDDESWFAEESYFMAKQGYSSSNFFKGFIKEDVRVVVQHKLFIYTSSALFTIFGFSLSAIRIIPLFSSILLIWMLYLFSQRANIVEDKIDFLIIISILLTSSVSFYFIKIARPEMMVTLFGFISFSCLYQYLDLNKKKYLIFSAVFAGMAFLTHLNGLIFIATGFVALLIRKKYYPALLFLIFSILMFTPYFIDIYNHYDIFKEQINNPLINSKTNFSTLMPIVNLLREHERLFRKPEIIVLTIVFLFNLIYNFKTLIAKNRLLVIYTILLMVFLGLIVEDKTIKYSLYLIPFQALLLFISIKNFNSEKLSIKIVNYSLITIFIAISVFINFRELNQKFEYADTNAEIGRNIPEKAWCVAPMNFIFNEIERLNIASNVLLRIRTNNNITLQTLYDFCINNGIEYFVQTKYSDPVDKIKDIENVEKMNKLFDKISDNENSLILKIK